MLKKQQTSRRNRAGLISIVSTFFWLFALAALNQFRLDHHFGPYGWIAWCREHPRMTADAAAIFYFLMLMISLTILSLVFRYEMNNPSK